VTLGPTELTRFDRYVELLTRWNERINLTRVIDPVEVVHKHFLDSLAIVPHVRDAASLVDVGSGAGFPGVVVAIALPALEVTLIESIHKKAAFLEALKRDLALPLQIQTVRLEAYGGVGCFDVAVSRATFPPAEWVQRGAPLVSEDGLLIAMLAREQASIPSPPGFAAPQRIPYSIPTVGERSLLLLRKRAHFEHVL
jgi:16S rRNA (guanine527-N7)-methyltransferase